MATACATELGTRSDGADLPPWPGFLKLQPLLDADARAASWRIVETFSQSGLPFELEISWSSGGGAGANAKVTVARSTRICVYARGLRVRAGNLADLPNRVGVTVSDAYVATENQWEAVGVAIDQAPPMDVPIPPFARRVRLELADPALLPTTTLAFSDGTNTLRSTVQADRQPDDGVPVAGARRLTVTLGGATAWRAVFTLAL